MAFIPRMALRELRASWQRLIFFFICVAVGVGGIVALRSLVQNVRTALTAEARSLTAGDVYVRTDQPWSDDTRAQIDARVSALEGVALTETLDTVTMARMAANAGTQTKVVEVRGVQEAFPFYGRFGLESGTPYSPTLLEQQGALVGGELLSQLGVQVGDAVAIGNLEFTIRDVIVSEPGRQLGGFSFGPRVLVAYDALERTGILGYASRAERQILLKVPEDAVESLVRGLRRDLSEAFVRVGSYRRTENRIERNLGRAENYLSLIGFVVVILGGIGVWSVTRVFVQQRLRSVAVLKCLGATTARVMAVYVAQVALLGLGGGGARRWRRACRPRGGAGLARGAGGGRNRVRGGVDGTDRVGGGAGVDHWRARLDSVRARAVARYPPCEAAPAAATGRGSAASRLRLGPSRGHCRGRRWGCSRSPVGKRHRSRWARTSSADSCAWRRRCTSWAARSSKRCGV